ncbi:hypothetical protein [Streptomyces sp. NPDC054975]
MNDVTDAAPEADAESDPGPAGAPGAPGAPDEETGFETAAPAPLGVERVPTGRAVVDALLERLADADRLPADGHLEVYEDVHRGLRDELTSLDAVRPGPAPGPGPNPGPTPGPGPTPPTSSYDLRS